MENLLEPMNQLDVGIASHFAETVALSIALYASVPSLPNRAVRLISAIRVSLIATVSYQLVGVTLKGFRF